MPIGPFPVCRSVGRPSLAVVCAVPLRWGRALQGELPLESVHCDAGPSVSVSVGCGGYGGRGGNIFCVTQVFCTTNFIWYKENGGRRRLVKGDSILDKAGGIMYNNNVTMR